MFSLDLAFGLVDNSVLKVVYARVEKHNYQVSRVLGHICAG